jgi:hypothetical protein
MATTTLSDKTTIPDNTSAGGHIVPAKAAGKKAKDIDSTSSYPLEVRDDDNNSTLHRPQSKSSLPNLLSLITV